MLGRDPRPSAPELVAVPLRFAGGGVRCGRSGHCGNAHRRFAVERFGAAGGLMVTASHNPIEWNGIECLDHRGAPPAVASR